MTVTEDRPLSPRPALRLVAGAGLGRTGAGAGPAAVDAKAGPGATPADQGPARSALLLGHHPRSDAPRRRPAGFLRPPDPPAENPAIDDDGESHLLCIAPTGAGKGRSVIIPNLLDYQGSCIVIDPKGEAARITAQYRRQLGQRTAVIAPFDPGNGESLNPLDLFDLPGSDPVDAAYELTSLLGRGVASGPSSVFWDVNASTLIRGVMLAIRMTEPPERQTLATLSDWLTGDDVAHRLAVLLDRNGDDVPAACASDIAGYLNHNERVRDDVLSTAITRLDLFASAGVRRATGPSSVRLLDLLEDQPLTVYLVLPVEKLYSHGRLLRLWLGVVLSTLLRRTRLPRHKTLVMLDECAALGELDALRTLVCLMRGFGVRCAMFFQDAAQLRRLYPKDWQTMINNTVVQTFGARSLLASRDLDEMLGLGDPRAALQAPRDAQFLCLPGRDPIVCERFDYLRDPMFAGRFVPDPMRDGERPQ